MIKSGNGRSPAAGLPPSPDADLISAIVNSSGEAAAESSAPPQTWLLRFRDDRLEMAYLQADYQRNRRQIVASSVAVTILIAAFYWLDFLAPSEARSAVSWFRLTVSIPCSITLVVGSLTITRVEWWTRLSSATFSLYLLKQSALLLWVGASAFRHFGFGVVEGLIGLFFVSHLPLRQSMTVALSCCAAFLFSAIIIQVDKDTVVDAFAADCVIVFAFSAFAVYRFEKASRLQFISRAMLQISYERRLASEADRRRWLEIFASFLSHELKNALIGVSSSIELASRTRAETVVERYFARARHSLDSMRRLLAQVTNATSLESALAKQEFETFDLASLVVDRVDDFRQGHPGRRFELVTEPETLIDGNPDAVLQLIDKLVGNAIEHGEPSEPIRIDLTKGAGDCRLAISNVGDALPAHIETLFQPFVTQKDTPAANGNLGLGLFIARTIATHHRGALRAEPLQGAVGARFTLDLPLAAPAGQEPSQR